MIIDEEHDILGYQYYIILELLRTLEEMTTALPYMGINAGNQENYPTRHYTVWHDYKMESYKSAEYKKQLPASKEWCEKNGKLFEYLSDGLRMISPITYMRYGEARSL